MSKSKITIKYRTALPRDLQGKPGIDSGDPMRVTVADTSFLKLQGSIKVGPGSAVEDVKKARELRGTGKL